MFKLFWFKGYFVLLEELTGYLYECKEKVRRAKKQVEKYERKLFPKNKNTCGYIMVQATLKFDKGWYEMIKEDVELFIILKQRFIRMCIKHFKTKMVKK